MHACDTSASYCSPSAVHSHLLTATKSYSPKMSKMIACLGSIPMATSFITAACALNFFASHICTWQLWPDLTSADGSGMKTLSKELNTSALRCGKTVAADGPSQRPGDHDSMCCCHWYCTKHRLQRGIVLAGFKCPQSAKSHSSKYTLQ